MTSTHAALFALAVTLFVAGPAAGATAWISWLESKHSALPDTNWHIIKTFNTREECEHAQRSGMPTLIETQRKRHGESAVQSVGDDRFTVHLPDGRTIVNRLLCLPDTIDPREPRRLR